jgi:nucleoside-diphosphate-sugar epimerase
MEAPPTAKRLVFASSQGVHGDIQDREPPLRSDTPVSPTNEYGRQKVACEVAIRDSKLEWTILRLAAVAPIELQTKNPGVMFDYSPEARFEFVHPHDAGIAFGRVVACREAIGKVMFVAGGERCRTTFYEFCTTLMAGIGMGHIPREAFIRTEVPTFLGDWVDTDDSQRLLRYQTRDMSDLVRDMRRGLGILVPLIRTFRPLATWFFITKSAYLKENQRRARLEAA